MRSEFSLSDPRDRARSLAATAAIHILLGAALLTGLALKADRKAENGLKTFDVDPLPPPPPETIPRRRATEIKQPATAGKKSDPSPIVAPPVRMPVPQPIPAAPTPGIGSASTSGAAVNGTGTGAGGIGDGRGGGGSGGDGAGRVGARLISGALGRRDYRQIDAMGSTRGSAELLLLINPVGRVRAVSRASIERQPCRRRHALPAPGRRRAISACARSRWNALVPGHPILPAVGSLISGSQPDFDGRLPQAPRGRDCTRQAGAQSFRHWARR